MKLEEQVCNLELSKRLKELGVKQESLFWWCIEPEAFKNRDWYIGDTNDRKFSAFTVAELGDLLPPDTPSDKDACWMQVSEDGGETHWDNVNDGEGVPEPTIIRGGTEADMRAKMLIHLIKSGLR